MPIDETDITQITSSKLVITVRDFWAAIFEEIFGRSCDEKDQ